MSELERISQESMYDSSSSAEEEYYQLGPTADETFKSPSLSKFDDPEALVADYVDSETESPTPNQAAEDKSATTSLTLFLAEAAKYPLLTAAKEVVLAKEKDVFLKYREELKPETENNNEEIFWEKIRSLPPDEQEAVIRGKQAFDLFMNSNLRLVVSIAKKYRGHGLPFLDLIQEGCIGLNRAVEKFDWTKGFKFSTYATWWIRQAVQRAVSNQGSTIRLPVHIGEQLTKIRKFDEQHSKKQGYFPSDEEISKGTGFKIKQVREAKAARELLNIVSLDKTLGDDHENSFGVFIANEESVEPTTVAEEADKQRLIQGALGKLPERERMVLEMRFGFYEKKPASLEEIGRMLGITRERVRQLEIKALHRLAALNDLQGMKSENFSAKSAKRIDETIFRHATQLEKKYAKLTDSERKTLVLMTRGLTKSEIASEFELSESTIKGHQIKIRSQLGVETDEEAVQIALEILQSPEAK